MIFGYARRGINPTIYAAATLLIVSVTVVVVAYSVWVARQTRKREREIAAATRGVGGVARSVVLAFLAKPQVGPLALFRLG